MNEIELFNKVKQRDKVAFDALFRRYYVSLCRFSYALCHSQEEAEESVQEMFIHLWERAPLIKIDTSLKAYLYTSARNHTLNTIRKNQTELQHISAYAEYTNDRESDSELSDTEISDLIRSGIDTLPGKCREIFILCKQEGLTYEEISEYLNISKKTIDNQMGIAIRKLREYLKSKMQKILLFSLFYLFLWG